MREFVGELIVEKIGEEKATVIENFCLCLRDGKKYEDHLEVVKILFDIYAANGSSKWVIPLTADAISKSYENDYNNPYYTSDILSNMRAMLLH